MAAHLDPSFVCFSDGRRPDRVDFGISLMEDLARRDFTINAMAVNVRGRQASPQIFERTGFCTGGYLYIACRRKCILMQFSMRDVFCADGRGSCWRRMTDFQRDLQSRESFEPERCLIHELFLLEVFEDQTTPHS